MRRDGDRDLIYRALVIRSARCRGPVVDRAAAGRHLERRGRAPPDTNHLADHQPSARPRVGIVTIEPVRPLFAAVSVSGTLSEDAYPRFAAEGVSCDYGSTKYHNHFGRILWPVAPPRPPL